MAMEALILACEAQLQSQFAWTDRQCAAQLLQEPPPFVGQFFAAVVPGQVTQLDDNPLSLDETYGVVVAITHKLAYAPQDRRARQALLRADDGPVRLGDRVGAFLHGSYGVLNAANALIPGFNADTNGFVEPLRLQSIQYQPVDSGWLGSAGGDDDKPVYLITVVLGGARRVRVMGTVG